MMNLLIVQKNTTAAPLHRLTKEAELRKFIIYQKEEEGIGSMKK